MYILIPRHKFRRNRNTPCSFNLIPCQHPNPHSSIPQQLQRPFYILLQLIFHTRQTQQLQIMLQIFRHNPNHRFIPPLKSHTRLMIPLRIIRIRRPTQPLPRHHKRPQPLPRHIRRLLLKPIIPLHNFHHHHISALLQKHDLARGGIAHDDAHSFGFGGEGEDVEDVVGYAGAVGGLEFYAGAVPEDEGEADGGSPVDDGYFVWGGGLVGD